MYCINVYFLALILFLYVYSLFIILLASFSPPTLHSSTFSSGLQFFVSFLLPSFIFYFLSLPYLFHPSFLSYIIIFSIGFSISPFSYLFNSFHFPYLPVLLPSLLLNPLFLYSHFPSFYHPYICIFYFPFLPVFLFSFPSSFLPCFFTFSFQQIFSF